VKTAGKTAIVLVVLLAAAPAPADLDGVTGAEPPATPPGWLLPPPAVQLEMDAELIPVGKGAVFVPAMSEAAAEPPYLVLDLQGEVVTRSPTGSKTILAPGRYQVKVGSGVEEQMMTHQVTVHEGHSTLVEPDWAGMIVRVVDEHGTQIRGTYEIFALPSGEDFGLGLGADETRGETLRTWLLPPGRYMLVRSGETPRARTDFLTVRLEPGELTHFTLVQDEEGNFEGGGVVDRWEGRTEIENWRLGLIVGGDALWNRNDHVPGRSSGNSVSFNAFVDFSIRYLDPDHLAYFRLQVDEGGQAFQEIGEGFGGLDLSKTIDEVDLDAIYTYRLLSWLGPYVRFGLNTNLFPGFRRFNDPYPTVVLLDSEQREIERRDGENGRGVRELRLAESFDPLELKEGLGVSFDLSPSLILDLHLRLGVGARHNFIRSLLIEEREEQNTEDPTRKVLYFVEAEPSHLLGAEATLIGSARLTRWVLIDTELDTLVPFYASAGNRDPVVNWKNTISLRLVSFASVAYVVKLDYNKQLSDYLQFEQRVLLRFTFDIL